MIKSFSKHSDDLLNRARLEECPKRGEYFVLPEHIVFFMLQNPECYGYKVLEILDVDIDSLADGLEHFLAENAKNSFDKTQHFLLSTFSKRTETMIDVAVVESRTLKCPLIGTEHLLIAACREDNSFMENYIKENGISVSDLRSVVRSLDENRSLSQNAASSNMLESGTKTGARQNPSSYSYLAEYSKDLTQMYKDGLIDTIVGREKEIYRAIEILERRSKNNPILVGSPGVGKTAIVEGLSIAITKGQVSENLLTKKILMLDLAAVIAGTKFRGEFEDRLKRIIKELKEKKNIILFIDEIHTIIGAGSGEGTMDAANILKPALSRGEIQCIGATTLKEYRKYFEKDAALERRFQPIFVKEPTCSETVEILNGIKSKYEEFHGVKYKDSLMDFIAKYSNRYITNRFLPDKAIDILDEAGSIKKIQCKIPPKELAHINEQIASLVVEKENFVKEQNFEKAAEVRDQIRKLRDYLDQMKINWKKHFAKDKLVVDEKDVCHVISNMTGIPLDVLDENEMTKLQHLEADLHKMVVGQDEAISLIASSIRRSRSGVSSVKRPTGSFVFLGPTGVGKTLLAKSLAHLLFGSEESLIRVDMSDYMEKHNVSRLVGSPPGYVGYEEGGILTEQVMQNPYSVILFDEIEKAHGDVFNLLLQILEEGELKDNLGHVVNFRNAVIIMTSNAGIRQISTENRLGFSTETEKILDYKEIKSNAIHALKKILSPEILNRIDETIVFHSLSKDEILKILNIQLAELGERLLEQKLNLKVTKNAKDYLCSKGYEPSMGARPMRRLIQREIEDEIANLIIAGRTSVNDTICVDCKTEKLTVKVKKEVISLGKNDWKNFTDTITPPSIMSEGENLPNTDLFRETKIFR